MKLKVSEKTEVRIFWSKDKNKIKTPLAQLDSENETAIFNTHFQISAAVEIDQETQLPKEQMLATMKVKTGEGKQIGEVEFDVADFTFDKFKIQKYQIKQTKGSQFTFNPEETYIKVGLKGTKSDGKARR